MRWTNSNDLREWPTGRCALLGLALLVTAFTLASHPSPAAAKKHQPRIGIAQARVSLVARASSRPEPTSSSAPSVATVPSTFYGLNAQALFRLPASQWDEQLTKLAATGVGTVRFDTGWSAVEPTAPGPGGHTYNWTHLDQIVAALAQHHLQGLPIVDYAAPWAQAATGGAPTGIPPADPAVFAEFAQTVAARYGPNGAFWSANPGVPAMPINQYEIWNEENSDYFFHGTDAGLYAAMYADSRAAIHTVDPTAQVIVGGLVPTQNAIGWLDTFIASLPAHGQEIDGLGWHPYYSTPSAVYASLKSLHADLLGHGLNPPIVLTEVNGSEESSQSTLLSELALALPHSDCNVTGMIVHTWTPLAEDQGVGQYAIADPAGNLNATGLSYSAALQGATSSGIGVPAPICEAPAAEGKSRATSVRKFHRRHHRHNRGKHRHSRHAARAAKSRS